MDSIVEGKVKMYLTNWLKYDVYDCGTIFECMRALAVKTGAELDERFGYAGMAAGPEGRIASAIVDRALIGGRNEASDYSIRKQIDEWLRTNTRKGR